jgi:hypothetical protein
MSHDRGDSHWEDAKTWERACRHIALFLWWAAERGLASDDHDPKVMAKGPTEHFIGMCDTKLWDDDFNEEGSAFATAEYEGYLKSVSAYAKSLGIGDYDIAENEATKQHFFELLDRRLTAWRSRSTKLANKPRAVEAKTTFVKKKPKKSAKKAAKKPAKTKRPTKRLKKSAKKPNKTSAKKR